MHETVTGIMESASYDTGIVEVTGTGTVVESSFARVSGVVESVCFDTWSIGRNVFEYVVVELIVDALSSGIVSKFFDSGQVSKT